MDIELCLFSYTNLSTLDSSIRLELCSNYHLGGLSPSNSVFTRLRKQLNNNIYVMIRPRGGDFLYSSEEFQLMQNEIKWFKDNGADGFVFGILNEDASIDMKRTSKLVHLAGTLPVTFHRAFDISKDLNQSLEDIINCGCSRILSSGGASCVNNGFEKLSELHKLTKSRIDIMPGGGVTINNVRKFINYGFKNIHLSSKKNIMSKMITQSKLSLTSNPFISSYDHIGFDAQKFKKFVSYVRKHEVL